MLESIKKYAIDKHIPIMRENTIEALINLIVEIKPLNILEIGTAIGYSGIHMLSTYNEANLTTIEIDEDRATIARENFRITNTTHRVNLIIGDANEIIPCITEKYDLIVLDGPKGHYNDMLPYLVEMLNGGGVMFIDNVLYMGLIESNSIVKRKHRTIVINMRKFIDNITSDIRLATELLKVDDGIMIAKKRIE